MNTNNLIEAFRIIGYLVTLNGRKLWQVYRNHRIRAIEVETGSEMLYAATAPRQVRKKVARRMGREFRPIYGYRGGAAPDHKETVAALRCTGLPEANNKKERNRLKAKRRALRCAA